ncbi:uncharacterized protein WCC33_000662 [Rhinophrynus dorsalis]
MSCVVVYLDDILIHSPNLVHRTDVAKVLSLLRANNLFCKLEKCEFHQPQRTFLGYVISSSGLAMDPGKLSAVLQWPLPMGLKAIQRFLGFTNYYRKFINQLSTIVKPLTDMTHKSANASEWSPKALQAFERLKAAFAAAPVLRHPNQKLPFTS